MEIVESVSHLTEKKPKIISKTHLRIAVGQLVEAFI